MKVSRTAVVLLLSGSVLLAMAAVSWHRLREPVAAKAQQGLLGETTLVATPFGTPHAPSEQPDEPKPALPNAPAAPQSTLPKFEPRATEVGSEPQPLHAFG